MASKLSELKEARADIQEGIASKATPGNFRTIMQSKLIEINREIAQLEGDVKKKIIKPRSAPKKKVESKKPKVKVVKQRVEKSKFKVGDKVTMDMDKGVYTVTKIVDSNDYVDREVWVNHSEFPRQTDEWLKLATEKQIEQAEKKEPRSKTKLVKQKSDKKIGDKEPGKKFKVVKPKTETEAKETKKKEHKYPEKPAEFGIRTRLWTVLERRGGIYHDVYEGSLKDCNEWLLKNTIILKNRGIFSDISQLDYNAKDEFDLGLEIRINANAKERNNQIKEHEFLSTYSVVTEGTERYKDDEFIKKEPETKKEDKLTSINQIPKLVRDFMPVHQQKVLVEMKTEEHWKTFENLEAQIKQLPKLYATEKVKNKIVHLHYFYGGSDWFINEGSFDGDDYLFYGYVVLNGDTQNSEYGYITRDELVDSSKVELDFFWETKTITEAFREKYPELVRGEEKPKPKEPWELSQAEYITAVMHHKYDFPISESHYKTIGAKIKDFWQAVGSEYEMPVDDIHWAIKHEHRKIIEKAQKEGKALPPEVLLTDYPDLMGKAPLPDEIPTMADLELTLKGAQAILTLLDGEEKKEMQVYIKGLKALIEIMGDEPDKPIKVKTKIDYTVSNPFNYGMAFKYGWLKEAGISDDDIDKMGEIYNEVANRVGDAGSCVLGNGIKINGKVAIESYAQGSLGIEEIQGKIIPFLKEHYPNLKVEYLWGNMD